MFQSSVQTFSAAPVALAMMLAAAGCSEGQVQVKPDGPGTYYSFGEKVALSWFGIPVRESNAEATQSPTILISEPNGPGAVTGAGSVYVYEKTGEKWTSDEKVFVASGVNRDRFGSSLATKGTDVISGAPTASSGAGRAYVFTSANSTFTQQGTLQASDAAANDSFGQAVAIDGNTALVSAPFRNQQGTDTGVVYAFARTGTTWTQTQKLFTAIPDSNDLFGLAVLLDGTEAFISSIDDDGNPNYGGRVHVWKLQSGTWTEASILKPSDPTYAKGFGKALARQGNWLIVGAESDSQTAAQAGAVYVFERVGANWVERQKLRATDGAANDRFGLSVAIDGKYLVVGAVKADGKATNSGAAYVFELDGTWTFAGKLIASEGQTGDAFGRSCAVLGDQVVVGAPDTPVDGVDFAGAAYVFTIPKAFGTSQRIATEARRISFGRPKSSSATSGRPAVPADRRLSPSV